MAGRVVWHGDEFKRELQRGLVRNLSAASIYLSNVIKADISQPGTLRYNPLTKKGKRSKSQKTLYNFTHSRPGNPPYKQTGNLRRSITWEIVNMRGRVGTNVWYGRWLELGTGRMAPRPYLRSNLWKHHYTLVAIITRRIGPRGLPKITSNQFRSGHMGRATTASRFWSS